MLYRGMDRAQLDAGYNNGAAVPARDAIIADWAKRSDRLRGQHQGHLDLQYGDSPRERVDLFLAANPKAPTLAFIHGGYWQMNNKEDYAFLGEGTLPHGVNLALIEYTLAPAARLDRIVAEVRRATQFLAEHLGDYGADPSRLYISGHSAGGHLTAMTIPLRVVRGGIAISGIFDLEPIRLNYLNENSGSTRRRRSATVRSCISRRWRVSWSSPTAQTSCRNYAASRSTTRKPGSSASWPAICCRSTAPTISPSSRLSPTPKARWCKRCSR